VVGDGPIKDAHHNQNKKIEHWVSPQLIMMICFLGHLNWQLRATLDEGPKSGVECNNKAILSDESHILDPRLLDEGPKPKSGKSRLNLTWQPPFGRGKSIVSHPPKRKKKKRES
jgi:hypothetical protein